MKDLTRYITREEVRTESKRVRKGELLEKALAVAHRRLRLEYFDTSRIYNGICGYVPLNKLPASGSVPDLICSNHLHEAKNWDTTRYYIDRSKALSEIIPRGSNYSNYTKHLWIPKAKWQSNTKAYLIACGWQIHELPFVVTESNFELVVKWIMKELIKIYNLGYVNSLNYSCGNYVNSKSYLSSSLNYLWVHCKVSYTNCMMRGASLTIENDVVPLAERLNKTSSSRLSRRERKRDKRGEGGDKCPCSPFKGVHIRGQKCISLPSTQKIDLSYSTIYPKGIGEFLISKNFHNRVRTCMDRLSRVRSLASKFVLDIFDMLRVILGMLKTRVEGYGSVGVKLVNRLRSKLSSKLSKLFMCRSTHYYMVDKHEGRESKNKPTTRESCSTRSKARRIKHKQNSKQSTEALPRKTQEREEGSGEATMKVLCPLCNRIGYLEKHGRRYRIRHYVGYKEGRRIYQYHYLSEDQVKALGINEETGYKTVGIKRLDLSSINRMEWAGSLARIGRKPPKLVIVGSNPTPPATRQPTVSVPSLCLVLFC